MRGKDITIGETYSVSDYHNQMLITKIGGNRWASPHGAVKNTAHGHWVNSRTGEVNENYVVYTPLGQVKELWSDKEKRDKELAGFKADRDAKQSTAVAEGMRVAKSNGLPLGDKDGVDVFISYSFSKALDRLVPEFHIRAGGIHNMRTTRIGLALEAHKRAISVARAIDNFTRLEG